IPEHCGKITLELELESGQVLPGALNLTRGRRNTALVAIEDRQLYADQCPSLQTSGLACCLKELAVLGENSSQLQIWNRDFPCLDQRCLRTRDFLLGQFDLRAFAKRGCYPFLVVEVRNGFQVPFQPNNRQIGLSNHGRKQSPGSLQVLLGDSYC